MIEKFNFYDVYGYFLPGLALIAALWLPFGLVAHVWPTGDWGSALLTVALAYFLGHLMLYVSTKVIPSYDVRKSTADKTRYPSETVLDGDSSALPKELREKIEEAVRRKFNLEMHVENSAGDFDGFRKGAFFLARQALIREKAANYAEQFEGMYSLARGLVVVLSVATSYYLGWLISVLDRVPLGMSAVVLAFVALAFLLNSAVRLWCDEDQQRKEGEQTKQLTEEEKKNLRTEDRERKHRWEWYFASAALVALGAFGCIAGSSYDIDSKTCIWLALASIAAPALAIRCYMQYRSFTVHFASTVWRDFTTYALGHPSIPSSRAQFE